MDRTSESFRIESQLFIAFVSVFRGLLQSFQICVEFGLECIECVGDALGGSARALRVISAL